MILICDDEEHKNEQIRTNIIILTNLCNPLQFLCSGRLKATMYGWYTNFYPYLY